MHTLTAKELKKKVFEGGLSACSIVEHYLNRIQKSENTDHAKN